MTLSPWLYWIFLVAHGKINSRNVKLLNIAQGSRPAHRYKIGEMNKKALLIPHVEIAGAAGED
jgi:hypothetical protein